MNEIANVFNYDGYNVRTVVQKGEPWFVAKDVCEILGFAKGGNSSAQAVSLHCREEGVMKYMTPTSGGNQMLTYISERNLYRLVMRSRLASAEKFQDWVEEDVLPTIRKTGKYEVQENREQRVAQALLLANEILQEKEEIIVEQQETIKLLEPKAEVFDAIMVSDDLISIDGMAKLLNFKVQGFRDWVKKMNYVRNDRMPAALMMNGGFMDYKETAWENGFYSGVSIVPYFTQKAIPLLRNRAEKEIADKGEFCSLKRDGRKSYLQEAA